LALKELRNRIAKRIINGGSELYEQKIQLTYSRLRSTSGTLVLNSIRQRIFIADVIIFDITGFNANVMIELGIALEMQLSAKSKAKVFLIAESKTYDASLLPSDLAGYFLTNYWIDQKDNECHFGDNGSLVMRISTDALNKVNLNLSEDDIFND
jgi:hypothetical protein